MNVLFIRGFKKYTLKGEPHISSYCYLAHQRKSTLFSVVYHSAFIITFLILMINQMAES